MAHPCTIYMYDGPLMVSLCFSNMIPISVVYSCLQLISFVYLCLCILIVYSSVQPQCLRSHAHFLAGNGPGRAASPHSNLRHHHCHHRHHHRHHHHHFICTIIVTITILSAPSSSPSSLSLLLGPFPPSLLYWSVGLILLFNVD